VLYLKEIITAGYGFLGAFLSLQKGYATLNLSLFESVFFCFGPFLGLLVRDSTKIAQIWDKGNRRFFFFIFLNFFIA